MEFANRMQKHRYNLKKNYGKYKEHLRMEQIRDRQRRAAKKESMDAEALKKWREHNRERQKLLRERKRKLEESTRKTCANTSPIGSYKSKKSLKKAVTIVKRSLPKSPSKRIAVIQELAGGTLSSNSELKSGSGSSNETICKVQEFFQRDDISVVSPGKKEFVCVKNTSTGIRQKFQKRYLLMSISECFNMFETEYPGTQIGKSKFFALRPSFVRPIRETPQNMCVCVYHANFCFFVQAIKNIFPSFPPNPLSILDNICCNLSSELCLTNRCKMCYNLLDLLPIKFDHKAEISWKSWIERENRMQLTAQNGTLEDFLVLFDNQLKKFKPHWLVQTTQSKHFRETKETLLANEAVLQIDFAENYEIVYQDEIQNAHWRHRQATIFTACVWVRVNNEIKPFSYAILSDDLTHSKTCVWKFLRSIVSDIKARDKNIGVIHIFSDGCAAQFKNRYNLYNVCSAVDDFGAKITWSFFATSHGKGAVDGIGAVVKRTLWTAVKARKVVLKTPKECFEFLQEKSFNGIKILYHSMEDIAAEQVFLDQRWAHIAPIKNLQEKHFFIKDEESDGCLFAGRTAKSTLEKFYLRK